MELSVTTKTEKQWQIGTRAVNSLELGNLRKGDHGSVAGKKPVFDSLSSYLLVLPARGESVVVSCGFVSSLSWRCYHVFVIF